MILQRSLSLLSNRLYEEMGGRRIPEEILERDYCIAWLLAGLSRSPLRQILAFKGGTALRRCYFPDYRFSEDLDFTLTSSVDIDFISTEFAKIFPNIRDECGIAFRWDEIDRDSHTNSHTFYLGYEGPLPARDKRVKVDVTIREKIVIPPVDQPVLRTYVEFEDLPEDRLVSTYPLLEIAAEKVLALTDKSRNEPRDLYDLWYLIVGGHVELWATSDSVSKKLAFRSRVPNKLGDELAEKEDRLSRLWEARLKPQVSSLPEFEEVFRVVARAIRQSGIDEG